MIIRMIVVLFLLFVSANIYGQFTIEYYDVDWNRIASKEKAEYYREITYDEDGWPAGKIKDYFITGEIYFEGELISVNPDSLDGVCIWYYQNGLKRREATYRNGTLDGPARYWSEDGKEEGILDDSGLFFSEPYRNDYLADLSEAGGQKLGIDSLSIDLLLEFGVSYVRKKELDLSLLLFRLAYDMSVLLDHKVLLGQSSNNIGYIHHYRGSFSKAVFWYTKAMEIREKHGSKRELAESINNIGGAYSSQGNYKEALDWYTKAKNIHEESGRSVDLALAYNNIGIVYRSQGNYSDGLKWLHKARAMQEDLNLPEAAARSYNNIGGFHDSRGEYAEALQWYKKAKSIYESLGLEVEAAGSYNNIGFVYRSKGDYSEGLKWYIKAMEVQKRLGLEVNLAISYNNIGFTYNSQGNYGKALEWYAKAIEVQKRLGLMVDLATSYNNIGAVYSAQGNYSRALQLYDQARRIQERLELEVDLATSYNDIGFIYDSQGSYGKALEWYAKAKEILEKLGLEKEFATSYNNIGAVYSAQGNYSRALQLYDQARRIQERLGLEVDLALSYNNIGFIHRSQGNFAEALQWYNKSTEIRERLDLKLDLVVSYNNISLLYHEKSKQDSAFQYAQKCIQSYEELRQVNTGQLDRHLYVTEALEIVEVGMLNALLLDKYDTAFAFSEVVKARTLSDLLVEKSVKNLDTPEPLREMEASIIDQLNTIEKNLSSNMSGEKRKNLQSLRDSLYQTWQEIKDRIKSQSPEYVNLVYPEVIDAVQLQSILREDEVLISFFAGQTKTLAFTATTTELQMLDLGATDSLSLLVETFRTNFISEQKMAIVKADPIAQLKAAQQYFELTSKLFRKLWLSLDGTGLLQNRKVILIPDGFLNYLPFELLIKDQKQKDYHEYQYLLRDHSISYYPSATLLHFERSKEKTVYIPNKEFLGLGVSQFRNTTCGNDGKTYSSLGTIAGSIDRLRNLFPSERSVTLLDDQANESNIKKLKLSDYRYLYFATHGVINTETPDFSSILLQPGAHEDGCLNMYEIFDLDFNADLVTLAACQTGLGKLVRGEGMVGFTRALMYAGTPSVVLSLWEVADESTNQLFLDFYSKLAKDGSDKYEPLRSAQLKMIESGTYSNPYYWAPFVFIGKRASNF